MTDQPTPEVLPIVIEQEEYPIWVLHAARACTDRKFGLKMREDHPSVAEFNDLLFAGAIAAHAPKPEASVPVSELNEIQHDRITRGLPADITWAKINQAICQAEAKEKI
ncbi:MAG: hypothetical protein ACYDB1_01100 [Acidiferrobacteraceae bacterium]